MGNNEVVGPYGPSTFNQNFLSSRPWLERYKRLNVNANMAGSFSVIQQKLPQKNKILFGKVCRCSPSSVQPWWSTPEDVYSHYENNLRTLLRQQRQRYACHRSSVPVNVRHSAPFASAHNPELSDAQLTEWQALNEQVGQQFSNEDWSAAVSSYNVGQLIMSMQIRIFRALENMSFWWCQDTFQYARLRDTQRFRTNTVINGIINKVVKEEANNDARVDNVTALPVSHIRPVEFTTSTCILTSLVTVAREFTKPSWHKKALLTIEDCRVKKLLSG